MVSMAKTTRRVKSTAARIEAAKPAAVPSEPAKPEAPKPNRVSLEIITPGAKNVCVAGSFNEWQPERTPLAPLGNGRWAGDLAVQPGRHEYLFVVDGQWLPDPKAKESVQNPFGGQNSVLVVTS
jgi:1,4-alpha-glucan branching enzyme